MTLLLDTSAIIDILVKRKRAEQIRAYVGQKDFFISYITVYELNKAQIVDPRIGLFIRNCNITHPTVPSALESAAVYKKLKEKGRLINELDILIAGIAITENMELLTCDVDFEKISEMDRKFKLKVFR